jgi:hypothetical protein
MRLAYASESESPMDRAWRKIRKLAGGKLKAADNTDTSPPRPKGMHHRTYERLLSQLEAAEDAKDAAWMVGATRLLARFGELAGHDPVARALRAELAGLRR